MLGFCMLTSKCLNAWTHNVIIVYERNIGRLSHSFCNDQQCMLVQSLSYLWLRLMTYKHVPWQHFIFMIVVVNHHHHYHHYRHHQSLSIIINIIITITMRLKLKSLITTSAILQPCHHMAVIIIRNHHLEYLHPHQQHYRYRYRS